MNIKMDINRNNKHSEEGSSLPEKSSANKGGIVKIDGPATRIEQENHNANHVLHYIALVALSITHQIRRAPRPETAERIHAHLSCLREFLEESDLELNAAVEQLLKSLGIKPPASRREWITFIAIHANELQILSKRYGGLKNQELSKMTDLYMNKQWIRIWWWKTVICSFVKRIRACGSTGLKISWGSVRKAALERFSRNQKKTVAADEKQTKRFFMSLFSNVTCVMEFKIFRLESYATGKSIYEGSAKNQILYLLNFIKHHYPTTPETGESLWAACDYLHKYFTDFPNVTKAESQNALYEMDKLCKSIGVSYKHKFSNGIS